MSLLEEVIREVKDSRERAASKPFGKPASPILMGIDSLSSFGSFDSSSKLWRRELPLPSGRSIHLLENPIEASEGGEYFIWPASLTLSAYIIQNQDMICGKSVIELGASHAMVSLVAASQGARLTVATDREHVIPFLHKNLSLNRWCR
jgi:hypothetical protein